MFETKVSVVLIFPKAFILTIRVEIGLKVIKSLLSRRYHSSEWDVVNENFFLLLFEFSYEERGFPTIPLIGTKPAFQTGLAVADRTSEPSSLAI